MCCIVVIMWGGPWQWGNKQDEAGVEFDEAKDVIWWKRGPQTGYFSVPLNAISLKVGVQFTPICGWVETPWGLGKEAGNYNIRRLFNKKKQEKAK